MRSGPSEDVGSEHLWGRVELGVLEVAAVSGPPLPVYLFIFQNVHFFDGEPSAFALANKRSITLRPQASSCFRGPLCFQPEPQGLTLA